jgi:hypothetical protein
MLHPRAEYIFASGAHRTYTKTDHILRHESQTSKNLRVCSLIRMESKLQISKEKDKKIPK